LSRVEFESGSQLYEVVFSAFDGCSLRSICFPSSLLTLGSPCFSSCQLSSLTFESPSHLVALMLAVGGDFCGTEIEVPSSVCLIEFSFDNTDRPPLVVDFDRDSRLCCFKCYCDCRFLATRRAFSRFSERTLKYFREVFSDSDDSGDWS
jgi:hypothetical protein